MHTFFHAGGRAGGGVLPDLLLAMSNHWRLPWLEVRPIAPAGRKVEELEGGGGGGMVVNIIGDIHNRHGKALRIDYEVVYSSGMNIL
jgi:hypothetical protein